MTAEDLKKSILQEAIQGKLVPQVASEGTGKELLERILKEKAELIKEKKLKKEKPLEPITEEEIPFEIPESWCWCRLGEIAKNVNDGVHFAPKYFDSGIPCYSAKDIYDDSIHNDNCYYINDTAYSDMKNKIGIEEGSILISKSGSIGRSAIVKKYYEFGLVESIGVINLLDNIYNRYIKIVFDYTFCSGGNDNYVRGIAIKHLTLSMINNVIIPLPPLAEQKRIVEAIEKFMPLVEEYGKREFKLNSINNVISEKTKKAVLQEAISGALTEGWRKNNKVSETGKELLNRILKEKEQLIKEKKLKKEKPLEPITEEEIPFDIPESWCWCRLGEIGYTIGNKNNQILEREVKREGKIPVVSQGLKLIDGYCDFDNKMITDIPVILFGDHTRVVKFLDFPFVIAADGTKLIKLLLVNEKYIYYWMFFTATRIKNRGYARHFSLLRKEFIPLPPLEEQKQIVKTLENLLPLCEKL